jgi:hypothetical protein
MPGLVPGIHVSAARWIAGTSPSAKADLRRPAMTIESDRLLRTTEGSTFATKAFTALV